jgi:hypothetical protein
MWVAGEGVPASIKIYTHPRPLSAAQRGGSFFCCAKGFLGLTIRHCPFTILFGKVYYGGLLGSCHAVLFSSPGN